MQKPAPGCRSACSPFTPNKTLRAERKPQLLVVLVVLLCVVPLGDASSPGGHSAWGHEGVWGRAGRGTVCFWVVSHPVASPQAGSCPAPAPCPTQRGSGLGHPLVLAACPLPRSFSH